MAWCKLQLLVVLASLGLGPAIAQEAWTEKERIQWEVPENTPLPPEYGATDQVPPGLSPDKIIFFNGKASSCKNLLGGMLHCCKETIPQDLQSEWWSRYRENIRQSTAEQLACTADQQAGAWASYNSGANYKDLQDSTTGQQENLDGGGQAIDCGAARAIERTQDEFMAYARTEVRSSVSWYCSDLEFDLAVQRNVGECSYVGTRCASSVLGMCVVEREVYCCFNSPVSRKIRESMVTSGLDSFGTAKHPQCEGVPFGTMRHTQAGAVATGEIEARMTKGDFLVSPTDQGLEHRLTGAASAMGNPGRQRVSERTGDRMAQVDFQSSQDSIEDSQRPVVPTEEITPGTGPGRISFGAPHYPVRCHSWATIPVTRDGGVGSVSVYVEVDPEGSGQGWAFDERAQGWLTWGPGDVETKWLRQRITGTSGAMTIPAILSDAQGGAVIGPYEEMTIFIPACP